MSNMLVSFLPAEYQVKTRGGDKLKQAQTVSLKKTTLFPVQKAKKEKTNILNLIQALTTQSPL